MSGINRLIWWRFQPLRPCGHLPYRTFVRRGGGVQHIS